MFQTQTFRRERRGGKHHQAAQVGLAEPAMAAARAIQLECCWAARGAARVAVSRVRVAEARVMAVQAMLMAEVVKAVVRVGVVMLEA